MADTSDVVGMKNVQADNRSVYCFGDGRILGRKEGKTGFLIQRIELRKRSAPFHYLIPDLDQRRKICPDSICVL